MSVPDSTARAILEQEAKIAALEARVIALSDAISRATAEIASIKPRIEIESSRLDGMREIVRLLSRGDVVAAPNWDDDKREEDHRANPTSGVPSKRRMRLGPKKRVVFQLIANGVTSFAAISKAVQRTDIDVRFLRDCFRTAAVDGEIFGNAESYTLTALGAELLEKAPVSKDWDQYVGLFNSEEEDMLL